MAGEGTAMSAVVSKVESGDRREIRPAELEVLFRLANRFPDLAEIERELTSGARQVEQLERDKAELEERVRALTQPRLTVTSVAASPRLPADAPGGLRPRSIREARELLADRVITKPELRRMLGYPPESDEEQDAAEAAEASRRPPRYAVARVVWGTLWRLAPVLAGPGPFDLDIIVKDAILGALALALLVGGLLGLPLKLGLAGSLWRVGLATLGVGIAWQLGPYVLAAAVIAAGVVCIGDVLARILLQDE